MHRLALVLGWTLAAVLVGAAIFLPLVATRDHTVARSVHAVQQTQTRNAFWQAVTNPASTKSTPGFVGLASYPDLVQLSAVIRSLVHSPDPARALQTWQTTLPDYKHTTRELGIPAVYRPCDAGSHDNCGVGSPYQLENSFSLDALQATPRNVQQLNSPLPSVLGHGNLGWQRLRAYWVLLVVGTFFVALAWAAGDALLELEHERSERREDLRYLDSLGPRERDAVLLRRRIEAWPYSPERTAALRKADSALKTIRSGELNAEQQARLTTALTELDSLVVDSKNWQQARRAIARGDL